MKKNQIIFLILVLISISGGIIGWALIQKAKLPPGEKITPEEKAVEVFSLSGMISGVDTANNSLKVSQPKEGKEYKINLSQDTEIVRLKFPFDPANPPKEATFTPERIPITINDLKIGDSILVESNTNIYGKTEIDDVSRIQVLP